MVIPQIEGRIEDVALSLPTLLPDVVVENELNVSCT